MKKWNAKNLSFKKLLFIPYFGFSLLMILLIMLASFVIINALFTSKTFTEAEMELNAINEAIANVITENNTLSQKICSMEDFESLLRAFPNEETLEQLQTEKQLTSLLNRYWYSHPEVLRIRIYTQGQKYSLGNAALIQSISKLQDIDPFEKALSLPSALITDYALTHFDLNEAPNFDAERMVLITRIDDFDDEPLGYLALEISKSALFNRFLAQEPEASARIFALDTHGRVVISATPSQQDVGVDPDLLQKVTLGNAAGEVETEYDGKRVTLFYSETSTQGWKVARLIDNSDVYYWQSYFWLAFVGIAAFFILIAYLFSHHFAKRLIYPVTALSDAMERLEGIEDAGLYSHELNTLYNQYNTLLAQQRELLEETHRKSELQKDAEIKSLMAQINPHFLFNTLNSIGWNALNANVPEICTMLSKLSKLCRISYNISSMTTTVADELVHVNLYMDLQQLCFNNKFTYTIDAPQELTSLIIPKFILQPIVENSIIHGFTQIERAGQITITLASHEEKLSITITDNGSGIPMDILEKLNAHQYRSQKYGVYNINERIKQLCGDEYGLLYFSNGYSHTTVVITLPIQRENGGA